MFVLDTDHIGIIQWQNEPAYSRLSARIEQHSATDFYFPIVSFHEQVMGWNAYISKARTTEAVVRSYLKFQTILTDFQAAQVLPFDSAAGARFDSLRRQRLRIGTMDLRIASIVLARSMTLLTCNASDFGKIPGLQFEDWTIEETP